MGEGGVLFEWGGVCVGCGGVCGGCGGAALCVCMTGVPFLFFSFLFFSFRLVWFGLDFAYLSIPFHPHHFDGRKNFLSFFLSDCRAIYTDSQSYT